VFRLITFVICLIDEVETHLHIELQHKALPLLTTFFPNIQFIVTTHSPFVVNSIENCKVYDLVTGNVIEDPSKYSSDAVTKVYFKADKYSDELKIKVKRYEELSMIKNRTEEQNVEYQSLRDYFNEVPTQFSPELKSILLDIKLKTVLND
jgi:predicted ATP-binding protein involved in virulence